MTTPHPPRCLCPEHRAERSTAARASLDDRTLAIQSLNGRMADAGRLLASTTNELSHITTVGIGPGLLDVAAKRQGAPAAATAWAERLGAAVKTLDVLLDVLRPLLIEAQEDAQALAETLAVEWAALQAAEQAERDRQALEDDVADGVRRREAERLAAVADDVRAERLAVSQ